MNGKFCARQHRVWEHVCQSKVVLKCEVEIFIILLAVALDTLIADIPVDANLEKALSPIINPVVQYIVSTPALATPLASLLGVNSQLVSSWTPHQCTCWDGDPVDHKQGPRQALQHQGWP